MQITQTMIQNAVTILARGRDFEHGRLTAADNAHTEVLARHGFAGYVSYQQCMEMSAETRARYNVANEEAGMVFDQVYNSYAPEGMEEWKCLGSGSFRVAFLGPDGLVYKVGDTPDNAMDVQVSEAFHAFMDEEMQRVAYVPVMVDPDVSTDDGWTSVIIAEYCPRDENGPSYNPNTWGMTAWRKALHNAGFIVDDDQDSNVYSVGGRYTFVDCGNFRPVEKPAPGGITKF